jgi:glutathione S-transferase
MPKFLDCPLNNGLLEKGGDKWIVPGDEPTIADCATVAFL